MIKRFKIFCESNKTGDEYTLERIENVIRQTYEIWRYSKENDISQNIDIKQKVERLTNMFKDDVDRKFNDGDVDFLVDKAKSHFLGLKNVSSRNYINVILRSLELVTKYKPHESIELVKYLVDDMIEDAPFNCSLDYINAYFSKPEVIAPSKYFIRIDFQEGTNAADIYKHFKSYYDRFVDVDCYIDSIEFPLFDDTCFINMSETRDENEIDTLRKAGVSTNYNERIVDLSQYM